MQVGLCSCTVISVLSLCFPVAAVLEGLHFSFGSRRVPVLFQLLILLQSAMSILLFFGYFTNKLRGEKKKEYPKHLAYIFLIEGHAGCNCFCSHFNFTFSLEVVLLFLLQWHPCCLSTEEIVCRCWGHGQIPLSLLSVYISRCYGSTVFPVLESCPTVSLE